MPMAFRVGKLVAIITGGGSGLGRATAQRFVKLGGKVTIVDKSESTGGEAAEELGDDNCVFCHCDVTNTDEMKDAIDLTMGKFGAIHVLVNCAGTSTSRSIYNIGRLSPHPIDLFQDKIDSNIIGTFNAIRCVVPEMTKNTADDNGQRGVIINTSSTFAFDGQRGMLAHSISKAAVASMTLPLARDLSHKGIRAVSISPGYFRTPILKNVPENVLELVASEIPFPARLGKPDEYAMLAQTIVENPYINGEVIRLDGGMRGGILN